MSKDIAYFIRSAKDQIRKEISFIDISEIINKSKTSNLIDLEKAIREDSDMNMGYEFGLIVTEYIESQGDKIDTMAAKMLLEDQQDRKAEADQDRHNARNGL